MTDPVDVREVGPRDGLQPESPVSVDRRVALIEALLAAGVTHLEAVAFVSPKAVPAMAGAAEVLGALGRRPGVTVAALVPNLRGAELAADTGLVDELTVTVSASEAYSRRNVNMSVAESLESARAIVDVGIPVDAVISCCWGSPYEGEIGADAVAALAGPLFEAGARVTLADTTGMATPPRVAALVERVGADVGLHLHETRGTGLLNAFAGLQAGVRRFDTSVGGLGGSPFAAGAAGNVATEGLVALLDDLGHTTGIDVEAMCDAAALAADLVGRPVPSPVASAGPRTRLAGA